MAWKKEPTIIVELTISEAIKINLAIKENEKLFPAHNKIHKALSEKSTSDFLDAIEFEREKYFK